MASDFMFDGVSNSMAEFTERSTGMRYTLGPFLEPALSVELLDGDEVVIPDPYGQRQVYSIRQRRVVRRD